MTDREFATRPAPEPPPETGTDGRPFPGYSLFDLREPGRAKPSIAVLLPAYNAGRWLDGCLSALSGNTEPHDLVIVDDGSIRAINESDLGVYRNKAVIIRLHVNSGIVHALNVGLSFILSQGYEFIARQDADDISRSDRLTRQIELMERNPQVGLSGSFADMIDTEDQKVGSIVKKTTHREIWNALCFSNQFVHSSFFIRSSHLRETGYYDPQFQGSEDYDLAFRIGRQYGLANIPDNLVAYRVHDDAISSNRFPQAATSLRVTFRHFRPWEWRYYLGVARKLVLLPVSRSWILRIRIAFGSLSKI
jgi:GT2 family glycosyltransferase